MFSWNLTFDDYSKWLLIGTVLVVLGVLALGAIFFERKRRSKMTPEQKAKEDSEQQFSP